MLDISQTRKCPHGKLCDDYCAPCEAGERADERSEAASTANLDFEQRQEVERVLEWLTDCPDEAAAYIVLLESRRDTTP